ncbi:MAG TPA: hypothetical protein VGR48_13845 [Terriglobales bacterium]|nr:hypothetical protein [Terriglobales bacterium]
MRARAYFVAVVVVLLAGTGLAKKKKPRENNGFIYDVRLGVAEVEQQGQVCLTIRNAKLKPGDSVAVISTEGGVEQARVTARLEKSCSRDRHAEPDDTFYTLQLAKKRLSPSTLGLGIADYTGPFENNREFVGFNTVRLEGKADYFSSCAGSEGVNLLVWNGLPHQGTLEWHRYYYLGYDVETTCTEADTTAMEKLKD